MTRVGGEYIKTLVSILIMVVLNPLGNVLLRKGMREITVPTTWMAAALATWGAHVLSSGTIWLGIAAWWRTCLPRWRCCLGLITARCNLSPPAHTALPPCWAM